MKLLIIFTRMLLIVVAVALIAPAAPLQAEEAPESVTYTVTWNSTWSQATHPHSSGSLPGSAHWSRLVGATHNDSVTFWETGQLATTGIKNVAEFGSNGVISNEVNAAIMAGTADQYIFGPAIGTAAGTIDITINVDSAHPRVTLLSMIAPSPDWFIGVNGLPLQDSGGNWHSSVVVDLFPYDAGTDDGTDYSSGNAPSSPFQPISRISGVTPFSTETLGTLTFTLQGTTTAVGLAGISAETSPSSAIYISLLLLVIGTALGLRQRREQY